MKSLLERVRFSQFVNWTIPIAVLFGIGEFAAARVFDASAFTAAGVVTLLYGGCLFIVRDLLRRGGELTTAVLISCTGLLIGIILIAAVIPVAIPALTVLPIVVVALALPHLPRRRMRVLIWAAWIVGAGVATLGFLVPEQAGLPAWFTQGFRVASTTIALGLAALLLWHHTVGIDESRERAETADLERRKTESELRLRESRFRALIENSSEAIALFSAGGDILYGSPSTLMVLGYPLEEFVGRNAFDLIHEDDRGLVQERLETSLDRPGEHIPIGARVLHKDGSWRELEGVLTNMLDQPGVEAIVNNYRDITERKFVAEQTRESEERYRSLFQRVPVSLWELDFSGLPGVVRDLREAGVEDLSSYFAENPHELSRFTGAVTIVDMNERTLHLFEAPEKELLREGLGKIFGELSIDMIRELFIALGNGSHRFDQEVVLYTLNGAPRNINLRISVPKGYEQSLSRVFMSTIDITARMQAEEQVRRNAARAAALAEISKTIVTSGTDYRPKLESVAARVSALTGDLCMIHLVSEDQKWLELAAVYHPEPASMTVLAKLTTGNHLEIGENWSGRADQIGRTVQITDIPASEFIELAYPQLREVLDRLNIHSASLCAIQAVDLTIGTLIVFRSNVSIPHSEADLIFFEDIADRIGLAITNARLHTDTQRLNVELEQRVKKRTAQLEAINAELEAFTYSVSHDLRGPLRHTAGYIELLQRHTGDELDDKSRRFLTVISEESTRMGELIDDLLEFSRMGHVDMQEASFDSSSLVREILGDLESETEGRRVVWNIETLPEVYGDRNMLRQVWLNLLTNALKYSRTRDPAVISIGCDPSEEGFVFCVRDNGVGFSMKYVDKLFGIFQRLHRLEDFEGTGIGLANVQRVIHRHGGRVWAEAEEDAGAAFFFTLPAEKGNGQP